MPYDDPTSCPGHSLKYNRKFGYKEYETGFYGEKWQNAYQERKKEKDQLCDFHFKKHQGQLTLQAVSFSLLQRRTVPEATKICHLVVLSLASLEGWLCP